MYSIFWKNKNVGTAETEINGLYYHITCQCCLPEEGLYDVIMRGDGTELSLGLCVPKAQDFGLEKRVPIKQAGTGPFRFMLKRRNEEIGIFLPVEEGKPFAYIQKLKMARLAARDGALGITYSESSSPTGQ